MNPPPLICRAVLEQLARRYARRRAGRTGAGVQRVLFDYEEILHASGCADGPERTAAEEQLREAARRGWIALHAHRRDASLIHQIEFLPAGEPPVFALLAEKSPTREREDWQAHFRLAAAFAVPEPWSASWRDWCLSRAEAAGRGQIQPPFNRKEEAEGRELLRLLAGILSWRGESLIRFASCVLCGESKRLEQWSAKLETALTQITGGAAATLEAHGILHIPRTVLAHGPLRLEFAEGTLDLGLLHAPVWLSEADLLRASRLHTTASRCLTVENETTMQELAKQQSGTLLIHTSYPSSAVLALLRRLPAATECWHFGDSDPRGFDILRDLRARSGRRFHALHMTWRPAPDSDTLTAPEIKLLRKLLADPLMQDVAGEMAAMLASGHKGKFEQELRGFPTARWPYYTMST